MKSNVLVSFLLVSTLAGCAAGTAAVHDGNIDVYTNLLVELGPESEDTSDEARRRSIYLVKLNESLKELEALNPPQAQAKREAAERILGTKI
jgi:hypothetical protein